MGDFAMTIFILLGIGIIFLILTSIIIAMDNKKRKKEKKMLSFHWRVLGIGFTVISITCFVLFVKYTTNFQGSEYGDRKILLRTTMDLGDITLPSKDSTLDQTLDQNYKQVISKIQAGNSNSTLKYVDALLNKKQISFSEIHEVKYSSDLTKNQVQIVEYLVICKSGYFTKPEIYYYIIFGEELQEELKKDTENDQKTKKKNSKKESNKTK